MKKILVHVGPPKSGTSAIQKWLSHHRRLLADQGFYYPEHGVDENGISSGNVLNIFAAQSDNSLHLDEQKIESLLNEFEQSSCHTLVLSSEFFFKQMAVLNDTFPNATFLAYLRFPLDVAESSYNQGIKRHGETRALGLPARPRSYQLEILESHIKKIGSERFILRPYHRDCFVNQSLICDFLHHIGLVLHKEVLASMTDEQVNTSYTLEALEFKRWLNQFDIEPVQQQLDGFLQGLRHGRSAFSLIPPAKFSLYKEAFVENLGDFCHRYEVSDGERFIKLCENLKQKEFVKQEIDDVRFEEVFVYLLKKKPGLIPFLTKLFADATEADVEKYPHRLIIVNKLLSGSLKYWYLQYKVTNGIKGLLRRFI